MVAEGLNVLCIVQNRVRNRELLFECDMSLMSSYTECLVPVNDTDFRGSEKYKHGS